MLSMAHVTGDANFRSKVKGYLLGWPAGLTSWLARHINGVIILQAFMKLAQRASSTR